MNKIKIFIIIILLISCYLSYNYIYGHDNRKSNELQFIGWLVEEKEISEQTFNIYFLFFHKYNRSFIFCDETKTQFFTLDTQDIKNNKTLILNTKKYTVVIDK